MPTFDLTGRVAVVTGGGQGIGEGIALAYARAGAAVVVAARHTDRIERVAAAITAEGHRALAVTTDVTDAAALEALADAAVTEYGGLDVWVNNAGGSSVRTPLREISDEDWEACLTLNLTAVWKASVIAAARMRPGGCIINVTSPAATRAVPGSGHYSAAKAGVNALTLTMSVELAPDIRVNGIAPGLVPTKLTSVTTEHPERREASLKAIPLRRLGTPDDMAGAALFLASPLSSYITGQTLVVDGGLTLS